MKFVLMAALCIGVSLITSILADGNVSKLFKYIKRIYVIILPISLFELIFEVVKNGGFKLGNKAFGVMLINILSVLLSRLIWCKYRKRRKRIKKRPLKYGMTYTVDDSSSQSYWVVLNGIIVACVVFNLIFLIYFIINELM